MFSIEDDAGGFQNAVRVEGDAVDSIRDEEPGELWVIAGSLAADADLAAVFMAGGDDFGDESGDGRAAFVEEGGDESAVAVDAEDELGEVVGSDAEAVEERGELGGEQDVAGEFAHHVHFQGIVASDKAVEGHLLLNLASFFRCAAEGDHYLQVGEAHGLAHPSHCAAFKTEGRLVTGMVIPACTAEPEHRVFFKGFVGAATDEVGVFVGLEVAQS